jgi:hypothetical protein
MRDGDRRAISAGLWRSVAHLVGRFSSNGALRAPKPTCAGGDRLCRCRCGGDDFATSSFAICWVNRNGVWPRLFQWSGSAPCSRRRGVSSPRPGELNTATDRGVLPNAFSLSISQH